MQAAEFAYRQLNENFMKWLVGRAELAFRQLNENFMKCRTLCQIRKR
jgi:hypothetical protein